MTHRLFVVCLAFASSSVLTSQAAAQYHFPVSTEASFGFRVGHGGTYVNRGGAAIDVVLGYRLRDTFAGTLIGGLTLGVQSPVTSSLECLIIGPGGECAPEFPALISGGALLGMQRGSARTASARILAGPMYYQNLEGGGTLGLQGRVDASTPPWMHTAVVASLRHSVLPSFRGEALGITSFGLGLRIQ
ncbi:MAG: hypothetical protein M3409_12035 [Gemmatimonadota bacterium]|nr:hypothetical protein [Gemmatimonadota bacterium]